MKYPSAIFKCSVCGYEEEIAEVGFTSEEVMRAARYGHLHADRVTLCKAGKDFLPMRFFRATGKKRKDSLPEMEEWGRV
jgi:rubredoxin